MFRTRAMHSAPLTSLKPILASSVKSQTTVRRMIGFRLQRAPNAKAVSSIIEKTKGDGLAGWAAGISRAALYLGGHNSEEAIRQLDELIPRISDGPLHRHAIGVRLRARNILLDAKEASLSVSGGATEAEVSKIRSETQEDYNALRSLSPGCWLVQLGCAEYSLYTESPEKAYEQLSDVEAQINSFITCPRSISDEVATNSNTPPYTLTGFKIQRRFNTELVKSNSVDKSIAEGIEAVATDPSAQTALAELKKELAGNLTDVEVVEVAITLHIANIRHHFMDYFKSSHQYEDWNSEKALHVKRMVHDAYSPPSVHVNENVMQSVRKTTPPQAFYAAEDKLQAILKSSPKDGSVIKAIRASFGRGPQTALCEADEVFEQAMDSLLKAGASQDTAGTTVYAKRQHEVAKKLAQQFLYRTKVQKGVALMQMGRLHEAVDTITPVILADEYIYMWRALLARSQAYKGLGLITNADKDHKTLEKLRSSLTARAPYEMC